MGEYRQAYLALWRGVEDALAAIGMQNFGQARELLKRAQCEAEEAYISAAEEVPAEESTEME